MYQLYEAQRLQNKKQADKVKKAQATVDRPADKEPVRQPDSAATAAKSVVEEGKAQGNSGTSELSSLDAVIDALNLARTVLKSTEIPKPPKSGSREASPKKTEAPAKGPAAIPTKIELPLRRPSTGYEYLRASSPQGLPVDEEQYPDRLERNPIHRALLAWSRGIVWKGWEEKGESL